mgnify:CR=1 FL=1
MDARAGLRTEAQLHGLSTTIDLPKVRVSVVEGPDAGSHYDSDDEMLVRIGTRENNGLVLSDKSISGERRIREFIFISFCCLFFFHRFLVFIAVW